MVLALYLPLTLTAAPRSTTSPPTARGSYAVVLTRDTWEHPAWREVAGVLRTRYDAGLVICSNSVLEAGDALARIGPHYACFICPPNQAGRDTVVGIHRMTRRLDDDPYTDLLWGILTGYEPEDALRIARHAEPLTIRSAASSMGPGIFNPLEAGFASSETDAGVFWQKTRGGETEKRKVDPDPTAAYAQAFAEAGPDAFLTSGHATEQDWQIGYTVRAGHFRCKDGQLFALGTDGRAHAFTSPNPKVYLPVGNCLIGHIPGKDCMATAWMHSGGVRQMFGYTAVTFHGYMGWGIGSLFHGQPGRYTLTEAFFFNNQALVYELQTRFPNQAHIEFNDFDERRIQRLAQEHRIRDMKLLGHLWDRDVVAFYGDPAWPVRWQGRPGSWTHTFDMQDDRITCRITVTEDGKWGNRPIMVFLPHRVEDIQELTCSDSVVPVVTDDFLLLPLSGRTREAGDHIEVSFRARRSVRQATTAASPPVQAGPAAIPDNAASTTMSFLRRHP